MNHIKQDAISTPELETEHSSHPVEQEPEFSQLVNKAISRRRFFGASATVGLGGFFAFSSVGCAVSSGMPDSKLMGFAPIATSTADTVVVPDGYQWQSLVSWGDPLFANAPAFDPSGNAPASSQALQYGDNTDGMCLFPLSDDRAVLAVNNEYTNYKHLFSHGGKNLTDDDVLKAQYAHGVSILEIERDSQNHWSVVQNSKYNRRIHVQTRMNITGPAAGHSLMKTKADPTGTVSYGTMNNCSSGQTPWGTYLTCEENFNGYFGADKSVERTDMQKMYGINHESRYNWYKHDERFDFEANPNEPHRFGWIVEIDPKDPTATPLKRTAMGRFKHENVAIHIAKDNTVVAYMGDDERGEHIYKFVAKNKYNPNNQSANRDLLVEGTLYAAKFSMTDEKGTGEWIELTYGKNGLTKANGFADQAEVLIYARKAAKHVGATTMDRPEWVAVHPDGHQVYCTLTNNKNRGVKEGQDIGGPNPRAENHYGQIVRWTPPNEDHTAMTFDWDLYVVAGNPTVHSDAYAGSSNVNAANMFNSPDGIGFDKGGRLWIQTDGNYKNEGDFAGQGNNQMLCGDPDTGEIRRFMVGPVACEITGLTFSEDNKTMFVGIQHPDAHFPAGGDAKPRSTVIAITRKDGGVIGA